MNRLVDRVVPTLTEVLDEQYWQPVELPLPSEVQPPAPPELPDLVEPLIDLSDLAVASRVVADTVACDLPAGALLPSGTAGSLIDGEQVVCLDDVRDAEGQQFSQDSTPDSVLRDALSAALVEAVPTLVDLLLPVLRRQLDAGPGRVSAGAADPAGTAR